MGTDVTSLITQLSTGVGVVFANVLDAVVDVFNQFVGLI